MKIFNGFKAILHESVDCNLSKTNDQMAMKKEFIGSDTKHLKKMADCH